MNKDRLQFLASGILFGFLLGFLIAYGVYEPRTVEHAAPVPAAGNLGMSGGGGGPAAADSSAGVGGVSGQQTMARVVEELNALKAAIEKNPKDVLALTRLANMYHDAGKYDQAVGFYRRILDVDTKDVDARTDMGICLREMGKSDDAIAQFRTSLSYNPKHWQTWLNLGVVSLFDKHDVKAASDAFDKVEELNPGFKDLPLLREAIKKARASGPPQAS